MWCIWMFADPRSDIAMEPSQDKRLEYIKKYYDDFDPDQYADIIETYISFIPEVEIVYNKMLLTARENTDNIAATHVAQGDLRNLKLKGDALASGYKIIDELVKRKKAVVSSRATEAAVTAARGGYGPSRAEQGLMGSSSKR